MGGCCPGSQESGQGPSERTSLLSGGTKTIETQPGRPRGISVDDDDRSGSVSSVSARKHKPSDVRYTKSSRTDIKAGDIVEIDVNKTSVDNVDKRLEDHANLFNYHLARYRSLHKEVVHFKSVVSSDDAEISIKECFKDIRNRLGTEVDVSVKRKFKYCMEIEYDPKKIVNNHIIEAFEHFNKANKLIREIIEKGPPLVNSVELVIQEDSQLRRDILVASLGDDGPDAVKSCMENIAQLKRVPIFVDTIKKETLILFEELMNGATILLEKEEEIMA
ncbi:unnamed protein product [Owenia fusiformis]|uniref:Uncharacterized protein n=1 Tax=Owenia fusiformis TaxID=6347 RepID=A0A8S4Q8L2_OWEFU|nr:unnamed protein product [Owenia fusiformis]